MYPAQTSFIPVQIALARWLNFNGWREVFTGNYPYWYLGTTPYRYLTGPVMPGLLVALDRLLGDWSWFDLMWLVMGISWLVGVAGVYWLVRELGGEKKAGMVSGLFYALGWFSIWSLAMTDGLSLVSFSGLVYVLVLQVKLLKEYSWKRLISLAITISFVLLLNSLILPSLVLGMIVIVLASGQWNKANQRIKQVVKALFGGWLIATLWYGLGYWWQLILAPSFAGKSLFKVVGQVMQLLPIGLAFGLAIVSGRMMKLKTKLARFIFYWLFVFGFLSLIRFLSDPDFWMDWIAYGLELQLGLGLLIGQWLLKKRQGVGRILKSVLIGLWLGVWVFLVKDRVIGSLRQEIRGTVEYRIGWILSAIVGDKEKVFLSGSSVFWLNSWFDVSQVRGGVDKGSVNANWRELAWEVREGNDGEKAVKVLKQMEVDWLVVHTSESEEYYGDFVEPDKFEGIQGLRKIYDEQGDRIYKIR